MFDSVPSATAFTLGPLTIGWYGIGYASGLAAAYLLLVRLSKRAGEDPDILGNGMIIVAVAALIGGRAYHVIDQWEELYKADPVKIFLPPVLRARCLRRDHHRHDRGVPVRPLEARPVPALGGHRRARASS